MKFKKQRDEEERLERAAKIQTHLSKTQLPKGEAEPSTQPRPKESLIWPPLQAWRKAGVFGRRYQFRPMTRVEAEAEDERVFMASQFKQDQAHAAKVEAAVREQETEQKRIDMQREQEERTGRRPYGLDHTCSLEEARRRGFLSSGSDSIGGNEWSSPENPHGLMGGGR